MYGNKRKGCLLLLHEYTYFDARKETVEEAAQSSQFQPFYSNKKIQDLTKTQLSP